MIHLEFKDKLNEEILFILFFSFVLINTFAQDNKLSFQFRQILFKDLADTIEKTIPVKIYYSNRWVDSLHLDIDIQK